MMNKFQKAWKEGYSSGRFWAKHWKRVDREFITQTNPYTNYMSGIRYHISWKMGFWYAFVLENKEEPRDWTPQRELYGF